MWERDGVRCEGLPKLARKRARIRPAASQSGAERSGCPQTLVVRSLTVRYGGVTAVDDVSFRSTRARSWV